MSDGSVLPAMGAGQAAPAAGQLKLLLVDDEAELRQVLGLGLQAYGLNVLLAGSADEALAVLRANPDIGALITDIRMPGRNGIELLAEIAAERPDTEALEAVVISGHGTLEHAAAAMRHGAIDYLAKPFTLAAAAAAAKRALERAAARRQRAMQEVAQRQVLADAQATAARLEARLQQALLAGGPAAAWSGRLRLLSHELRTPMVPVLGYSELLRDFPQDQAAVQQYGGEITRGANRLMSAIDRLLEFERLSDPALKPVRVTQLAAALVGQAWMVALAKAAGRQVELRLDIARGCQLNGDGAMLLTALGELLDNAISHSADGGVVEVAARSDPSGNQLAVRDHGPGWPAGVVAASDPAALMGSTNGLGLGLALARHVAELHGGTLLLREPAGAGALALLAWPAE